MSELYHRSDSKVLTPESKQVWYREDPPAVMFHCPCGKRLVYCTQPPHTIEFNEAGVLVSLGGSCGYHKNEHPPRPQNWCHFTIKDGRVEHMHSDSRCPGGDNSIP